MSLYADELAAAAPLASSLQRHPQQSQQHKNHDAASSYPFSAVSVESMRGDASLLGGSLNGAGDGALSEWDGSKPFAFARRSGRLDWNALLRIDLARVVRERDLALLQRHVRQLVFADLTQDDVAYFEPNAPDPAGLDGSGGTSGAANALHMFRLWQLSGEVLLHVQSFLLRSLQAKEGAEAREAARGRERIEKERAASREIKARLGAAQKQLKAARETIAGYERANIRLAHANGAQLFGPAADGSVGAQTGPEAHYPGAVYPCSLCNAAFSAPHFLAQHYQRRHPDFLPVQVVVQGSGKKLEEDEKQQSPAYHPPALDARALERMRSEMRSEMQAALESSYSSRRVAELRRLVTRLTALENFVAQRFGGMILPSAEMENPQRELYEAILAEIELIKTDLAREAHMDWGDSKAPAGTPHWRIQQQQQQHLEPPLSPAKPPPQPVAVVPAAAEQPPLSPPRSPAVAAIPPASPNSNPAFSVSPPPFPAQPSTPSSPPPPPLPAPALDPSTQSHLPRSLRLRNALLARAGRASWAPFADVPFLHSRYGPADWIPDPEVQRAHVAARVDWLSLPEPASEQALASIEADMHALPSVAESYNALHAAVEARVESRPLDEWIRLEDEALDRRQDFLPQWEAMVLDKESRAASLASQNLAERTRNEAAEVLRAQQQQQQEDALRAAELAAQEEARRKEEQAQQARLLQERAQQEQLQERERMLAEQKRVLAQYEAARAQAAAQQLQQQQQQQQQQEEERRRAVLQLQRSMSLQPSSPSRSFSSSSSLAQSPSSFVRAPPPPFIDTSTPSHAHGGALLGGIASLASSPPPPPTVSTVAASTTAGAEVAQAVWAPQVQGYTGQKIMTELDAHMQQQQHQRAPPSVVRPEGWTSADTVMPRTPSKQPTQQQPLLSPSSSSMSSSFASSQASNSMGSSAGAFGYGGASIMQQSRGMVGHLTHISEGGSMDDSATVIHYGGNGDDDSLRERARAAGVVPAPIVVIPRTNVDEEFEQLLSPKRVAPRTQPPLIAAAASPVAAAAAASAASSPVAAAVPALHQSSSAAFRFMVTPSSPLSAVSSIAPPPSTTRATSMPIHGGAVGGGGGGPRGPVLVAPPSTSVQPGGAFWVQTPGPGAPTPGPGYVAGGGAGIMAAVVAPTPGPGYANTPGAGGATMGTSAAAAAVPTPLSRPNSAVYRIGGHGFTFGRSGNGGQIAEEEGEDYHRTALRQKQMTDERAAAEEAAALTGMHQPTQTDLASAALAHSQAAASAAAQAQAHAAAAAAAAQAHSQQQQQQQQHSSYANLQDEERRRATERARQEEEEAFGVPSTLTRGGGAVAAAGHFSSAHQSVRPAPQQQPFVPAPASSQHHHLNDSVDEVIMLDQSRSHMTSAPHQQQQQQHTLPQSQQQQHLAAPHGSPLQRVLSPSNEQLRNEHAAQQQLQQPPAPSSVAVTQQARGVPVASSSSLRVGEPTPSVAAAPPSGAFFHSIATAPVAVLPSQQQQDASSAPFIPPGPSPVSFNSLLADPSPSLQPQQQPLSSPQQRANEVQPFVASPSTSFIMASPPAATAGGSSGEQHQQMLAGPNSLAPPPIVRGFLQTPAEAQQQPSSSALAMDASGLGVRPFSLSAFDAGASSASAPFAQQPQQQQHQANPAHEQSMLVAQVVDDEFPPVEQPQSLPPRNITVSVPDASPMGPQPIGSVASAGPATDSTVAAAAAAVASARPAAGTGVIASGSVSSARAALMSAHGSGGGGFFLASPMSAEGSGTPNMAALKAVKAAREAEEAAARGGEEVQQQPLQSPSSSSTELLSPTLTRAKPATRRARTIPTVVFKPNN
jgi:hypothetical protein